MFCPCALGVNRDLSIPRCEGEKVSAQHCSPVRGWGTSWSSGLSAWWPPVCSQGKTGMAKSSSPGCWLQHTEWNPGAAAARSSLEWVWEAPWQRGGFDAHPKHTAALGTEQFEVVCPVTTSCGQNCQIVIFFKCYVVHILSPVQAELNSQLAGLCWVPLCPHCGFYQVLVFLPETFIQNQAFRPLTSFLVWVLDHLRDSPVFRKCTC